MRRTFFTKEFISVSFSVRSHPLQTPLEVSSDNSKTAPALIDDRKKGNNQKCHEAVHSDCSTCSKTFIPTVLKVLQKSV